MEAGGKEVARPRSRVDSTTLTLPLQGGQGQPNPRGSKKEEQEGTTSLSDTPSVTFVSQLADKQRGDGAKRGTNHGGRLSEFAPAAAAAPVAGADPAKGPAGRVDAIWEELVVADRIASLIGRQKPITLSTDVQTGLVSHPSNLSATDASIQVAPNYLVSGNLHLPREQRAPPKKGKSGRGLRHGVAKNLRRVATSEDNYSAFSHSSMVTTSTDHSSSGTFVEEESSMAQRLEALRYADDHDLFPRLHGIMERLLDERPDDPHFFMLSQLRKWEAESNGRSKASTRRLKGSKTSMRSSRLNAHNRSAIWKHFARTATVAEAAGPDTTTAWSSAAAFVAVADADNEASFLLTPFEEDEVTEEFKAKGIWLTGEEDGLLWWSKMDQERSDYEQAQAAARKQSERHAKLMYQRGVTRALAVNGVDDSRSGAQATLFSRANFEALNQALQEVSWLQAKASDPVSLAATKLCGYFQRSLFHGVAYETGGLQITEEILDYFSSNQHLTDFAHLLRLTYAGPVRIDTLASPGPLSMLVSPASVPEVCLTAALLAVTSSPCPHPDGGAGSGTSWVSNRATSSTNISTYAPKAKASLAVGDSNVGEKHLDVSQVASLTSRRAVVDAAAPTTATLKAALQFRLMLRIAHTWLAIISQPVEKWEELLTDALLILIGYEGYFISKQLINTLMECLIPSLQNDFRHHLPQLNVEEEIIAGHIVQDAVATMANFSVALLERLQKEEVAKDLALSISSTVIQNELIRSRTTLLHSVDPHALADVMRGMARGPSLELADRLLLLGFIQEDDIAALVAVAFRCSAYTEAEGRSRKFICGAEDPIFHRDRIRRAATVLQMVMYITESHAALYQELLGTGLLHEDGVSPVVAKLLHGDLHDAKLIACLRSSLPQLRDGEGKRVICALLLLAEGVWPAQRVLLTLSAAGVTIHSFPLLCFIFSECRQRYEERPMVVLLIRWLFGVYMQITTGMPVSLLSRPQTAQQLLAQAQTQSQQALTQSPVTARTFTPAQADGIFSASSLDTSMSAGGGVNAFTAAVDSSMEVHLAQIIHIRFNEAKQQGLFIDSVNPLTRRYVDKKVIEEQLSLRAWNYVSYAEENANAAYWVREIGKKMELFCAQGLSPAELVHITTLPLFFAQSVERMFWQQQSDDSSNTSTSDGNLSTDESRRLGPYEALELLESGGTLPKLRDEAFGKVNEPCASTSSGASVSTTQSPAFVQGGPSAAARQRSVAGLPSAMRANRLSALLRTTMSVGVIMESVLYQLTTSETPEYILKHMCREWESIPDCRGVISATLRHSVLPGEDDGEHLTTMLSRLLHGDITMSSIREFVVSLLLAGVIPSCVHTLLDRLQESISMEVHHTTKVAPVYLYSLRRLMLYILHFMEHSAGSSGSSGATEAIMEAWEDFVTDAVVANEAMMKVVESARRDSSTVYADKLYHYLNTRALEVAKVFSLKTTDRECTMVGVWFILHDDGMQRYHEGLVGPLYTAFTERYEDLILHEWDVMWLVQHLDQCCRRIARCSTPYMVDFECIGGVMQTIFGRSEDEQPTKKSTAALSLSSSHYENILNGNENCTKKSDGAGGSPGESKLGGTALSYTFTSSRNGYQRQRGESSLGWWRNPLCSEVAYAVAQQWAYAEEWFCSEAVEMLKDLAMILANRTVTDALNGIRELCSHMLMKGFPCRGLQDLLGSIFVVFSKLGITYNAHLPIIFSSVLQIHVTPRAKDAAMVEKLLGTVESRRVLFGTFCASRLGTLPIKLLHVFFHTFAPRHVNIITGEVLAAAYLSLFDYLHNVAVLCCDAARDGKAVSALNDGIGVMREEVVLGFSLLCLLSCGSASEGLDCLTCFGEFSASCVDAGDISLRSAWTRTMAVVGEQVIHSVGRRLATPSHEEVLLRAGRDLSNSIDVEVMTAPVQHVEHIMLPPGMEHYMYANQSSKEYYTRLCRTLLALSTKPSHQDDTSSNATLGQVLEGTPQDLLLACVLIMGAGLQKEQRMSPTVYLAQHPNVKLLVASTNRIMRSYNRWLTGMFEKVVVHRREAATVLTAVADVNVGNIPFERNVPLLSSLFGAHHTRAMIATIVQGLANVISSVYVIQPVQRSKVFHPDDADDGSDDSYADATRSSREPHMTLLSFPFYKSALLRPALMELILTSGIVPRDVATTANWIVSLFSPENDAAKPESRGSKTNSVISDSSLELAGSGLEGLRLAMGQPLSPQTRSPMGAGPTSLDGGLPRRPPVDVAPGREHDPLAQSQLSGVSGEVVHDTISSTVTHLLSGIMRHLHGMVRNRVLATQLQIPAEDRQELAETLTRLQSILYINLLKHDHTSKTCFLAEWQMPSLVPAMGLLSDLIVPNVTLPSTSRSSSYNSEMSCSGSFSTEDEASYDEGGSVDGDTTQASTASVDLLAQFAGMTNVSIAKKNHLPQEVSQKIFFDVYQPATSTLIRSFVWTLRMSGGPRGQKLASHFMNFFYRILILQRVEPLANIITMNPEAVRESVGLWRRHVSGGGSVGGGSGGVSALLGSEIRSSALSGGASYSISTDSGVKERRGLGQMLSDLGGIPINQATDVAVATLTRVLERAEDIYTCKTVISVLNAQLMALEHQEEVVLFILLATQWSIVSHTISLSLKICGMPDAEILSLVRLLRCIRISVTISTALRDQEMAMQHISVMHPKTVRGRLRSITKKLMESQKPEPTTVAGSQVEGRRATLASSGGVPLPQASDFHLAAQGVLAVLAQACAKQRVLWTSIQQFRSWIHQVKTEASDPKFFLHVLKYLQHTAGDNGSSDGDDEEVRLIFSVAYLAIQQQHEVFQRLQLQGHAPKDTATVAPAAGAAVVDQVPAAGNPAKLTLAIDVSVSEKIFEGVVNAAITGTSSSASAAGAGGRVLFSSSDDAHSLPLVDHEIASLLGKYVSDCCTSKGGDLVAVYQGVEAGLVERIRGTNMTFRVFTVYVFAFSGVMERHLRLNGLPERVVAFLRRTLAALCRSIFTYYYASNEGVQSSANWKESASPLSDVRAEMPVAELRIFAYAWTNITPDVWDIYTRTMEPFTKAYHDRTGKVPDPRSLRDYIQLLHALTLVCIGNSFLTREMINQVVRQWLESKAYVVADQMCEMMLLAASQALTQTLTVTAANVPLSVRSMFHMPSARAALPKVVLFITDTVTRLVNRTKNGKTADDELPGNLLTDTFKSIAIAKAGGAKPLPQTGPKGSPAMGLDAAKASRSLLTTIRSSGVVMGAAIMGSGNATRRSGPRVGIVGEDPGSRQEVSRGSSFAISAMLAESVESSRTLRKSTSAGSEISGNSGAREAAGLPVRDERETSFLVEVPSPAGPPRGMSMRSLPRGSATPGVAGPDVGPAAASMSPRTPGVAGPDVGPAAASMSPRTPVGGSQPGSLPRITRAEVARHRSTESMWTIIHGHVYDVTSTAQMHPGGLQPILEAMGVDGTAVFDSRHGGSQYHIDEMQKHLVGILDH